MPEQLARIDTGFVNGAPAIRVWTSDRTEHVYRMSPSECAHLLKQLAGYLGAMFRPNHDRTAESWTVNPHIYDTQDVG